MVQLTLDVGQVCHLRRKGGGQRSEGNHTCPTEQVLVGGAGVYQAVGVDDGLVVVGLMSQSDGLMEETRRCLQLPPVNHQLHTDTHNFTLLYFILLYNTAKR